MKRVIIDTSSYEEILASFSQEELRLLEERRAYAVEGFVVVRKELRDISKLKILSVEGKKVKLRLALLLLYDNLTSGRSYPLDELMVRTAEEYFDAYVKEGGNRRFDELENDFEIVACASHKQVDIVVSEDRKTMVSDEALKAYEAVNGKLGLRMPLFSEVALFKKEIRPAYKEKSGGVVLD